jgi:guanylate cyclase soluble subunit beta
MYVNYLFSINIEFVSRQFFSVKDSNKNRKGSIHSTTNKLFSNNIKFSSSMLTKTFPFHIIFDQEMRIIQCGNAISRAIPQMKISNAKITDVFNVSRPHINFDYKSISSQIMSIFVLSTKPGVLDITLATKNPNIETISASTSDEKELCTRFKGQMIVIKEGLMLFQCSPSVTSVDDLVRRNLFLSDIPMYDASRDLVLMNEHWENEWNLTQNLEILTDKLKRALEELESEKKKTDK